ncbi:M48 family metallopeptidase [Rhizorhabdus wittichii]|uniref:M48 family metallopeptidase n=1 Tax=Rhizorhabdus wittichii TaxID=160791 RepID=UPI0002FCAF62|nr:M48 family metallopeptidase [Rhizorhabdus wittichii]
MSEPSEPRSDRAPAWLHDGQSAIRHDVLVALSGDRLLIDGFDPVPLDALRRIDARGLQFGRSDMTGWRLGFDIAPPAALLRRLPTAGRYGGPIDRIGLWGAAAIALCLSALVILGTIQGLDLLARMIPYRWEQRLGDAISGDFGARACRAPAGQAALDGLARRLSSADRPVRVGVVDIPVVNAVALPGGRILIFRGLIDAARSPDEVAGVLAHEIGHVEHRHVLVALLRRFGIGLLVGSGGTAADYGQALLESRYSRAAESEADASSIEHLVHAGISPTPTARLFDRLGRDEAAMPKLFVYMASHPPSAERRARFDAAAKRVPHPRPSLDPASWAAVRAMCGKTKPGGEFELRF